jgi:hypothetical protein
MEEPIPWRIRAMHITGYIGASINIIWDPSKMRRPMIKGNFRALYRSENIAMGTVATWAFELRSKKRKNFTDIVQGLRTEIWSKSGFRGEAVNSHRKKVTIQ